MAKGRWIVPHLDAESPVHLQVDEAGRHRVDVAGAVVAPDGVEAVVQEPIDSYRAVIQNLDGTEVWGSSRVLPSKGADGRSIQLTVPSMVLKAGDYKILITGNTSSGEGEEAGDYFVFHVVPR